MAFNREKAMTAAAKFAAKGQHDRAAKEYVSVIEADPSDTRMTDGQTSTMMSGDLKVPDIFR